MRCSARVLDADGEPVRGATIELVSRPLSEFGSDWGVDRLVYLSDARGRCNMRVLPGRLYRGWAWIDEDAERYRASPVITVAVRRNHTFRLRGATSLRVLFAAPQAIEKRVDYATLRDALGLGRARRVEFDADGYLTLPRSPSTHSIVDLHDATGALIDTHRVTVHDTARLAFRPRALKRVRRAILVERRRGRPLEGVKVFDGDAADGRWLGTTDRNGHATIFLAPPVTGSVPIDVSLQKAGYTRARQHRPKRERLNRGRQQPPLRFRMDRSMQLRGSIRIDETTPASGVVVLAESVPYLSSTQHRRLLPTRALAVADAEGKFCFEDLPEGRVALSCCLDPALAARLGRNGQVHWKAWLGFREAVARRRFLDVSTDFVLESLPELRVRLRLPNRTPARYANVMVSLKDPMVRTRLYCNHRGEVSMRNGIKGLMQIAALTHDGHWALERYRITENFDAELRLKEGLRIEGSVVDIAGQTVRDATVQLHYRRTSVFDALRALRPIVEVRSGADGGFVICTQAHASGILLAQHDSKRGRAVSNYLALRHIQRQRKRIVLQLR